MSQETTENSEIYEFGSFRLVPAGASLTRDGNPVEIQQKALALLAYLVRHHHRNVSKDQLQEAVWPAAIIVLLCIALIVQWVTWRAEPSEATGDETRLKVAVLPFAGTNDASALRSMAAGFTETLRGQLAIPGVRVMAEASSLRFRNTTLPADAIAAQLGVRYLIEGRVQLDGEKLRVHASLVSGRTGQRLWTQRIDGQQAQLFTVQDRTGASLLAALRSEEPTLAGDGTGMGRRIRGTDNLRAYQAWLDGTGKLRQRTRDTTVAAVADFEQALAEALLKELIRTDADGAAFQIAEIYAQQGEFDESLRWLDRAYEQRDPGLGELLSSNMFEPLYGNPAFNEFLERMTLPQPGAR